MHNKRNLFFILMLVLIISTTSFVCAADNITDNTGNEIVKLAVSDECVVEEIDESSKLGITNEVHDLEVDDSENLTGSDAQLLGVPNNEPVLGAVPTYTFTSDSTTRAITDKIFEFRDSGGIIYLNGKSFQGTGDIKAGDYQILEIKNVKVVGGSPTNPNLRATLLHTGGYGINFHGREHNYNWRETYGSSGCKLINVTFENIDAPNAGLVNFASGYVINSTINNCTSKTQFMGMQGSCMDDTPIHIWGCNFTNCHQTYPGANGVNDGSGQLGAVFGIDMRDCKFENTSSAQHGGALCIADESEWGSGNITSTIRNTKFINVESRWFAIYIHGNFSTSVKFITSPQIIEGCDFITKIKIPDTNPAIASPSLRLEILRFQSIFIFSTSLPISDKFAI